MAEMRADLGTAANDISTLQTFDGPAPETINSRCCLPRLRLCIAVCLKHLPLNASAPSCLANACVQRSTVLLAAAQSANAQLSHAAKSWRLPVLLDRHAHAHKWTLCCAALAPYLTNAGRLAMLGVVTGLAVEYFTGMGLSEQTADHPVTVLASFVILSIATYAPLIK
jgi:hypothetical protein